MWYRAYRRFIHYFRANNRHGTHSPFAYAFVEQVLNAPVRSVLPVPVAAWQPDADILQLWAALTDVYGTEPDLLPMARVTEHNAGRPRIYVLLEEDTFRRPAPQDIILVPGIGDSPRAYARWQALCVSPEIPMSMETGVMGLLFFREEFLIKQHFRLKRG